MKTINNRFYTYDSSDVNLAAFSLPIKDSTSNLLVMADMTQSRKV